MTAARSRITTTPRLSARCRTVAALPLATAFQPAGVAIENAPSGAFQVVAAALVAAGGLAVAAGQGEAQREHEGAAEGGAREGQQARHRITPKERLNGPVASGPPRLQRRSLSVPSVSWMAGWT